MSDSKTKLCNFRLPIELVGQAQAHAIDRDGSFTKMIERLIRAELTCPAPVARIDRKPDGRSRIRPLAPP